MRSARRSSRACWPRPPLGWRRAEAGSALFIAALTSSIHAWAQSDPAPTDATDEPALEPFPDAEPDDATEPASAPEPPTRSRHDQPSDIVVAAAPRPAESEDEADQLGRWEARNFPYPYPPAREPLPPPELSTKSRFRDDQTTTEMRWYGWQTLLVDGTNIAALLLASGTEPNGTQLTLAETAIFGYFVGPPIVHWANGQGWQGLASLGIRVGSGAALIVGATQFDLGGDDGDQAAPVLLLVTGALGLIAAIPIDAAALARKDVRPSPRVRSPVALELTGITPAVDVEHRWLGLSATGRF